MSVQESDKATRYIALLNAARVNGTWPDVPELVRKVDKHAPHRKCLTLAATSEAQTATSSSRRPATSSSAASYTSLLDVTPKLVQAIDQEKTHQDDAFQANVALHEIYFLRAEWSSVLGGLDHDVSHQVDAYTNSRSDMTPTTRLSVIKSRYFLGVAREQKESLDKALLAYRQALPAIEHAPADLAAASEYRTWAARLLGRICTLQSNKGNTSSLAAASSALISFRAWARLWSHDSAKPPAPPSHSLGPFDVSTKDVWSLYYHFLSFILASDLIYTASYDAPLAFDSPQITSQNLAQLRLQQRSELKQVENAYESLLLHQTRFPQASQSNEEVELWAQQAVSNWAILCGPRWRELDLGEGGKAAIGRSVLDILYRAATKTFHSTPILRHLFSVHASLAEFDLAIKAFDSYSDIIGRAKSRAEKTGHLEIGLDTDELVIMTAAQDIGLLCRYGSQSEGEKAIDVAKRLSGWLQKQRPTSSATFATTESNNTHSEKAATEAVVSPNALAAAYRAIGESQANWARLTHDPPQRAEFREKAIKSLRRAEAVASNGLVDLETPLLLATVLAENRELLPAIQVVKKALASSTQDQDSEEDATGGAVARRRLLIPLWHLMSLLLTARGEYENAVKISGAAFERLGGADVLFDDSEGDSPADQMEDSEKEGLLQLRVTQLALTELLDGPETAVDAGSEILSMYHRLFGAAPVQKALPQKDATPVIPSAAPALAPSTKPSGTLKSISGSILGRSRTARKNVDGGDAQAIGAPISTQITNDDGASAEKHHKLHIPHHPLKHIHHHDHTNVSTQQQAPSVPPKDGVSEPNGQIISAEQPLREIPHNLDHAKQPAPLGHSDQPPSQDLRLPAPPPALSAAPRPRYPTAQQQRHSRSLLVEVWLYIAGQYIRAEMFEDAEAAVDEAHKLVEGFQQDVAREDSSATAFDERGWGGGQSVNRLWADVWAERASLAVARNNPHDALASYERALSHYPDQPAAVVGISDILLDIYEQKIPVEAPSVTVVSTRNSQAASNVSANTTPSPATLTRLAARDRAYMLLNTLTKLGEGWDDSEAWSMLARAHELSGQVDRARDCLWFLVELEDGRPIRPWGVVSSAL